MKTKDMRGHNKPPQTLDDMLDKNNRVRITNKVMKLLKPLVVDDEYKERRINDADIRGFKARVHPGGMRTYYYQYRPKGVDKEKTDAARKKDANAKSIYHDKVKITLGHFDKHDKGTRAAIARKLAEEIRDAIRVGKDPHALIAKRKRAKTLDVIYDEFIKNRVKSAAFKEKSRTDLISRNKVWIKLKSNKPKNRQIYLQNKSALLIGKKKMIEIDKDDLVRYHTAVSCAWRYQANRCIEDIRLVFEYAKEKEYIKNNICHFKKNELNREIKRMDVEDPYDKVELKRIRQSALKFAKIDQRSKISCMSILAAAYMGGRSRSMIFNLEWDRVDMPRRLVKYIDTKNDEPMTLPFTLKAKTVLKVMLSIRHKTNPRDARYRYVFPTSRKRSKQKHIQDPRKTFKKICKDAQVKLHPLHFLRHSWATNAYEATGDTEIVRELGGWLDPQSVMVYVKLLKNRKKKQIDVINKFMNTHAK